MKYYIEQNQRKGVRGNSAETFGFLASSSARSYNSGHAATLCYAKIRIRRTSYVCKPLSEIERDLSWRN